MEKVDGPTMLADVARCPWRLFRHAEILARLHRQVHAAPGLDWLRAPFGYGDTLLHLDLHPDQRAALPARAGGDRLGGGWPRAAEADLALCWVLVALSSVPGSAWQRAVGRAGQRLFANAVLRHAGLRVDDAWLAKAARFRMQDPNTLEAEAVRMGRIAGPGSTRPGCRCRPGWQMPAQGRTPGRDPPGPPAATRGTPARAPALAAALADGRGQLLRGLRLQHRHRGPAAAARQLPPQPVPGLALDRGHLPGGGSRGAAGLAGRPQRAPPAADLLDQRLHARHPGHRRGAEHRDLRRLPACGAFLPVHRGRAGLDDGRRGASGGGQGLRLRLAGHALGPRHGLVGHPVRGHPGPGRRFPGGCCTWRPCRCWSSSPAAAADPGERALPRRFRPGPAGPALVGDPAPAAPAAAGPGLRDRRPGQPLGPGRGVRGRLHGKRAPPVGNGRRSHPGGVGGGGHSGADPGRTGQ